MTKAIPTLVTKAVPMVKAVPTVKAALVTKTTASIGWRGTAKAEMIGSTASSIKPWQEENSKASKCGATKKTPIMNAAHGKDTRD